MISKRERELLKGLLATAARVGPAARKRAGICRDCDQPVEGTPGRALRCAEHKRAANAASQLKFRRSDHGKLKIQEQQERRKAAGPREKIRIREREYRRRPDVRARRKAMRRRAAVRNPAMKRAQHQRYREKYPERVAEQQRRANAKRAAKKREYMHRYATKYVGRGLQPACDCGAPIPWTPGRGRPHKRCDTCDPRAWRRDQTGKHKAAA